MTNKKIVKLMLKSSNDNPYSGTLSKEHNVISAIELAKLFLDFADNGHSDEAMNIDSEQWKEVICSLENLKQDLRKLKLERIQ